MGLEPKQKHGPRVWVNPTPLEDDLLDLDCLLEKPQQGPLNWQCNFFEYCPVTELTELRELLREAKVALEYVVKREDYSFAECGVAEELWGKCKDSLAEIEKAMEVK